MVQGLCNGVHWTLNIHKTTQCLGLVHFLKTNLIEIFDKKNSMTLINLLKLLSQMRPLENGKILVGF